MLGWFAEHLARGESAPVEVGYLTLSVADTARARAFYRELFGWRFVAGGSGAGYAHVDNTRLPLGLVPNGADTPPQLWFEVRDIQAAVARVRALGGEATEPKLSASGWGADCRDDQGTAFSIWQGAPGYARRFLGLTPYLRCADAGAALDWLSRVLGLEEIARWVDADGVVREAEVRAGDQQIWLAGVGPAQRAGSEAPGQLTLVWVADVDREYERVRAAGVSAAAPVSKPYGVRSFTLTDPEGYRWELMQALPGVVPDRLGELRRVRPAKPTHA
jgi:predicted enzyme related to lactoylglutathione lyase